MPHHKQEFSVELGGRTVTVETGRLATQADGAVLVTCEKTQVLVTVCSAHQAKEGQDFFPLLVDYREKFYSAGKFLGGFMKRESRPSTKETLNSRLIDRPLRPLFPKGYMFETVIMAQVLSYGEEADPEVLAALGAGAAVAISDIPFSGPMGTCKVGKIDGQLVLNPTLAQWSKSELEIVVSASKDAILMLEGEGQEVSEQTMLEALEFAHEQIKVWCALVDKMTAQLGRPKREFVSTATNQALMAKVREQFSSQARDCLSINEKISRQNAIHQLGKTVAEAIAQDPQQFDQEDGAAGGSQAAHQAVDDLLYQMMRQDILQEDRRIGNRGLDTVRPIASEVNVLHSPHGSSLFTRGETQVMATVTIGGSEGEQMVDNIQGLSYSKFYLHYAFAPFCVGEARGVRGVSRRELGHGNLAERALKNMFDRESFPYTLRIMCEVLESNGSSSMASVCSASMALMDAGVPLRAPVAGVAMGLVKEGEKFKILTDILGDEDHLGDMDFKVAGSKVGITAIQMDIKITGITKEIFTTAMEQARQARLHILSEMAKTIERPQESFKEGVPTMQTIKIPVNKIGVLIGPGGKNIKKIQEENQVKVEVEDDGTVRVLGTDADVQAEVIKLIELQINGPKVGEIFPSVAVTIKEYGVFVDLAPGVSGLVHISEVTDGRINDIADYVEEGDEFPVRVVDIDNLGRLKLSAKAVKPLAKKT